MKYALVIPRNCSSFDGNLTLPLMIQVVWFICCRLYLYCESEMVTQSQVQTRLHLSKFPNKRGSTRVKEILDCVRIIYRHLK